MRLTSRSQKLSTRRRKKNRRTALDPFAVAAIRLLVFTGARLREILHAEWEHVDFERGILFLSDSKIGRKPIYLSAPALAALAKLPRIHGNPYLIPGRKEGEPRADLKAPWRAITKAAKLEGVRIHDFRHSFASVGAGASLGLPIIGKLLGHTQAATTHRYAHLDADPMRRAAETIGSTIAAAMSSPSRNVVPMVKSR
jgi:integrase